jgi:hypothetical protein
MGDGLKEDQGWVSVRYIRDGDLGKSGGQGQRMVVGAGAGIGCTA